MKRLDSLQVLRFVAAGLVLWCHAAKNLSGSIGVDVFFVLSGFIIARVAPGRRPLEFLRDRAWRVYPIYWLAAVPWTLIALLVAHNYELPRLLATATLWPVYGDIARPFLKVGWTLSFELLFYLAAAAVLAWPRRGLAWLGVGYAAALVAAFATGAPLFRFLGNPLALEFVFGVAIAQAPLGRRRMGGAVALLTFAAVVAWGGVHDVNALSSPGAVFDLTQPLRVVVWGVPAALAVWGALQFDPLPRGFRPLVVLGDASYSLYLTHLLALELLRPYMGWPWALAVCLALGLATHRYVEAPLMRWAKRPDPSGVRRGLEGDGSLDGSGDIRAGRREDVVPGRAAV